MVDQWVGSSDIFTDYEGTIVDATFQTNEYGTQMKLTFDDIEGRQDPVFEYYKVPDSYESKDGGDTITRVDGADKAMSRNSKWMRFVMAAAACSGGAARKDLGDDAPTNAKAWIGSRWKVEAEAGKAYKVKDKDSGEMKEGVSKDLNFPVAYLGMTGLKDGIGQANGQGQLNLSVLTDLHNPVLEQRITDSAKTMSQADWFNDGYKAIVAAGVSPSDVPDLITAMGQGLYAELGGGK